MWDYIKLKRLVEDVPLPQMLVDIDIFKENMQLMAEVAIKGGKKIRVATKSLRVPELISYVLKSGSDIYQGLMTYSARETKFLSELGLDDFLIAYPCIEKDDFEIIWELTSKRKSVTLMVDHPIHLDLLDQFWQTKREKTGVDIGPLKVCIDVDMSTRLLNGKLHIGVLRSPIRSLDDFKKFYFLTTRKKFLKLVGIMGYEAQVAGVGELSPFAPITNLIIRTVKKLAVAQLRKKREEIGRFLKSQNVKLEFFNAGGTGSLHSTTLEETPTEVTVGSGLLQSHLFDYYKNNVNNPAFCFGLRVTRSPDKNIVTCQSGGFVASGASGADKSPIPFRPLGPKTFNLEGYGEVQTPLKNLYSGEHGHNLNPGDPIFFRPSKSGEIAERFNEYLLIRDYKVIKKALTYRGHNRCFY